MINELMKYGNFQSVGKNQNKKQIILTNTSRNVKDYLQSLKYRYNGKYDKIPHFLIKKGGEILQLLNTNTYSNHLEPEQVNKTSIIICLENYGWLKKNPLNSSYINWIGDIYKGDVYEKKWRDYFFWQPYTETQIEYTAKLCKKISEETGIPVEVVEHNTRINGVEKFRGITSKSNFDIYLLTYICNRTPYLLQHDNKKYRSSAFHLFKCF